MTFSDHTDDQADSSTATLDQDLAADAADGAQSDGDTGTTVPFSEHPRWKEVYANLKEYKSLGSTPEQIRAALDRLAYYDQLAEESKHSATDTSVNDTDKQANEEKKQEALRVLEQLIPGISKFPEIMELMKTDARQLAASLEERAYDELHTLMASVGMPAKETDLTEMADLLVPLLKADAKLVTLYRTDPAAAVRKVWTKFAERAVVFTRKQSAAQQDKGAALREMPRAHRGGGSLTSGAAPEPPKTIDEAIKEFRQSMRSRKE